jgi:signal transduction histidine kinase
MRSAPSTPLRVLLLEDPKAEIQPILSALTRHGFAFEHHVVHTRAGVAAALKGGKWDLVLGTHSLPDFSVVDALRLVKNADADLPFIVVSDVPGEEAAVESMRAGAHDYVLRRNLDRLGPAIEREIREAANRRMQRSAQTALQAAEHRQRHEQRMESVARLAGGIAHDFNNLLTVILGFAEFLADKMAPGEPAHRDATEIRSAAQRASRLTRQLLAFSRQQVLDRRVVDLAAAVTELQPMITRIVGEDVACEFEYAPTPQPVLVDPGQFEQVMMNLAINARDAMPAGGRLRVAVDGERLDGAQAAGLNLEEGPYVRLTVSDSGTAIADDEIEFVFDPFFQTKTARHGSGLGLSTVFGIVKQSGGGIRVDSAPGRGTTFTIHFPVSQAPGVSESARAAAAVAAKPSTILIAEDEEGVRSFLAMALTRAGHHVVASASGTEAVDLGLRHGQPIDLLIADVVMPGLSGPEVADQLQHAHPAMRTLFLSGYSNIPERVATDPGAFLQKPFNVEALLAKIEDRLAVKP